MEGKDHPSPLSVVPSHHNTLVPIGEFADPKHPLASRLTTRHAFLEMIGTFFLCFVTVGSTISVRHLAGEGLTNLTVGQILVSALAYGLSLCAILYSFHPMLDVKHRSQDSRFRQLNPGEAVYIRAHNASRWLDGTVRSRRNLSTFEAGSDGNDFDAFEYTVQAYRTFTDKIVRRCDLRLKLTKGMVAVDDENNAVRIVSDGLSQNNKDVYDVELFDGSRDKIDIWSLRRPSRRQFVVCHFNPAVTYAACLLGEITPQQALMYFLSQIFGSVLGVSAVDLVVPKDVAFLALMSPRDGLSTGESICVELVLTFVLVAITLSSFLEPLRLPSHIVHPWSKEMSPLAVGFTSIALCAVGGILTGPSMNPALSLAPMILTRTYGHISVYLIGPWLGAIFAVLSWLIFNNFTHWDSKAKGFGRGLIGWTYYLLEHEMVCWTVWSALGFVFSLLTFGNVGW